ncbi:MAG: HlyD family type I secretion periplasmic adaptor subunit [Methylococcaceae bacterium]|nr:HlyD family type I secretion periplasmic adaptor subunit [Methylococcaceae bacterium]MDP3903434.1 HlyD family type I secretion periplasmic adaptor subunit [Methylococcaceae bacterium]
MSFKYKVEAYAELLRRYKYIFAYYWQNRQQLNGPLLEASEAEFLPAALSLQAKPVSPVGRGVAKILMTLVVSVLVWSIAGQIDIIVNADGKIIPSSRTKTIASVDVASVRAIHIQEGQFVHAGEMLIELDASSFDTERDKANGNYIEAQLQIARSKAMIAAVDSGKLVSIPKMVGIPDDKWQASQVYLEGQYRDFRAKLQRIDGDIARYSRALPLATQQALDYQELAANHDVAPHAYLEKEQARIDLIGQLDNAKNQRIALIAETSKAAFDTLHEAIKIAGDSHQDELRADSHSKLLKLTASVDGTVQQLAVHTIGGVVPAAQPLMQIVPKDSSVEIEATLENKDIGFVQEGQIAEVKIDAYEYTKYGTVTGKVSHVSRDAVQDDKRGLIYTVKITLDENTLFVDGNDMALSPGLSVKADIKTGTRRVIEYVLSPLLQHGRESLHER